MVYMQQDLLPLFPLRLVLVPQELLPLHIFEDRYKEMIGQAIEKRSEFGIVLASEDGIVNTGCTAIVERVVKRYDDGRMDIIAAGRRRFEILELNEDREYLRGMVEYFDDDDDGPPSPEARAKVQAVFEQLHADSSEEATSPEAPLSFRVAQLIPDLNFRQILLTTRSEAERIQRLAEFLPSLMQKMRTIARVRAVAPKNGHARHINS